MENRDLLPLYLRGVHTPLCPLLPLDNIFQFIPPLPHVIKNFHSNKIFTYNSPIYAPPYPHNPILCALCNLDMNKHFNNLILQPAPNTRVIHHMGTRRGVLILYIHVSPICRREKYVCGFWHTHAQVRRFCASLHGTDRIDMINKINC